MPIPARAPYGVFADENGNIINHLDSSWYEPEGGRTHYRYNIPHQVEGRRYPRWENVDANIDWRENTPFEATLAFGPESGKPGVLAVDHETNTQYYIPLATLIEWLHHGIIENGAMRGVFRVRKGRSGYTLEAMRYLPPKTIEKDK